MVYLATHSGGALLAVKDRRVYGLRRNGQLIYFISIQVASQHNTDTNLVVGGPAMQASYWIRLREGGGRAMSVQRFSAGMIDSRNGKCMLSPN